MVREQIVRIVRPSHQSLSLFMRHIQSFSLGKRTLTKGILMEQQTSISDILEQFWQTSLMIRLDSWALTQSFRVPKTCFTA